MLGRTSCRSRPDGRRVTTGSPSHVSLVVLSPTRVRRDVFDVLYERSIGETPEMTEWKPSEEVPSLTALSSKALSWSVPQ